MVSCGEPLLERGQRVCGIASIIARREEMGMGALAQQATGLSCLRFPQTGNIVSVTSLIAELKTLVDGESWRPEGSSDVTMMRAF